MRAQKQNSDTYNRLVRKITEYFSSMQRETDAVQLRRFAELLNVHKIRFRPLPAEGLLTKMADGYGIHIHCRIASADRLLECYLNEGVNCWLPARTRFALAHEFAHILIEEIAPARLRSTRTRSIVDILEITCNKLASEILLPRARLAEILRQVVNCNELLDVRSIAERFQVSLEVFINHLPKFRHILISKGWKGCVYLTEVGCDGCWKIVSKYISDIFSIASLRVESQEGNGLFLGRWDLYGIDHNGVFEFEIRNYSRTVIISCLIQRLWKGAGRKRYLITLVETSIFVDSE